MPSDPQQVENAIAPLSKQSSEMETTAEAPGETRDSSLSGTPPFAPATTIVRRARLSSFPSAGNVTPFPTSAATWQQGWVVDSQVIEEAIELGEAEDQDYTLAQSPEQAQSPLSAFSEELPVQGEEPIPPLKELLLPAEEPAPPLAEVAPTSVARLVPESGPEPQTSTALTTRASVERSPTPTDLPDSAFRKLSQLEAQYIGLMRGWLKDEGSKPDSPIARVAPGEQVHLAVEAINRELGRNLQQRMPADFAALAQAYLFGWGPLDHLMRLNDVTEVLVNGSVSIFVERRGRLDLVGQGLDDETVYTIAERMTGRRPTVAEPMLDDRLKDGSRLNATHSSVSLLGATLSIRRFPQVALGAEDLIRSTALTPELYRFLEALVRGRMNIVVSGGTNTGKTTLLNVLLNVVPAGQRLVIIEQAPAEIKCNLPNRAHLLTRPRTADGAEEVSVAALVRNALRMRPDRIVVGECRGGEALAMLQAMNTGHAGSLTTLHANHPLDALSRLETMVLMAESGLPHEAVRSQITRAIQIIVQTRRDPGGRRYISDIVQVTPSSDSVSGYACANLFETHLEQGKMVCRRTRAALDQSLKDQMLSYGERFDEYQFSAASGRGH